MNVTVEKLFQIIGSEHVKFTLLEEEVAQLKKLIEELEKGKREG